MPYTSLKGFSVQAAATNSGVWGAGNPGSDLNTGVFGPLDTMLAGVDPFSLTSSNVTLQAADVQNCMLRFTGTLLGNIVVSPANGVLFNGFYYWENGCTGNFTLTVTAYTISVVLPQARRGCLFVDSTYGPRIVAIAGSSGADPVPTGTVVAMYNNAAPAGWSNLGLRDYGMRIVSSGGGVSAVGNTAYSNVIAQTVVGDHALTTNEIPSHTHPVSYTQSTGFSWNQANTQVPVFGSGVSGATGGGATHNHSINLSIQTLDFILCSKN